MTGGLAPCPAPVKDLMDNWVTAKAWEGMDDFAALYEEMLPAVYRYATSRVGQTTGEEICGDVFHAAAAALSDGRESDVTPGWLMAVAKNKVIDHWRRQERRQRVTHLVDLRTSDFVEPSAEARASRGWSDVMRALDRLPERYRTLLTLRYLDDLTVAELARTSGQSESAIESALARARRSFRGIFEDVA